MYNVKYLSEYIGIYNLFWIIINCIKKNVDNVPFIVFIMPNMMKTNLRITEY